MLNEMNKIKRLLFFYPAFIAETKSISQVVSCRETLNTGSPPLTHRRITSLCRKHGIVPVGPQHGSLEVTHYQNGKRKVPFCGFTVNVCFPNHQRVPCTNNNLLVLKSGGGKEHASVCHDLMGLLKVIYDAY